MDDPVPGTATDPVDAAPLWSCRSGAPLVPDHLAIRRLGAGHRCETWLAWSTTRWWPVVVKLARPHQSREPRLHAALAREARCLARLPHPALPPLLADHRDADPPHLVLTYIDGPALDELLDDVGSLPARETAALGVQLASVLRWLHAGGLAHLDLTPANVVLRDRRPHLVDLGSARSFGDTEPRPGTVGTPGYTAPELEAGAPVTPAMDLYGLGAVLLHAITGEPPGRTGHPPPVPPAVPRPLRATITGLLQLDHTARPGLDETLIKLGRVTGPRIAGWPRAAATRLTGAGPTSRVEAQPRRRPTGRT